MTNEFPPRRIWLQGDGRDDDTTWAANETGEDVETAYLRADVAEEALAMLKDLRVELQEYETEATGESYNKPALNEIIAKLEAS